MSPSDRDQDLTKSGLKKGERELTSFTLRFENFVRFLEDLELFPHFILEVDLCKGFYIRQLG